MHAFVRSWFLAAVVALSSSSAAWAQLYSFSGTISFVSTMNASFPSEFYYGQPFTGTVSINKTVVSPNVQQYGNTTVAPFPASAVTDLTFTIGSTTYTQSGVRNYYGAGSNYSSMLLYDNLSGIVDFVKIDVNNTGPASGASAWREANLEFKLQSNGTTSNPGVITSSKLSDLDLTKFFEPSVYSQWNEIRFEDIGWNAPGYSVQTYRRIVEGTITSLEKGVSIGAVSSGTVAVPSGQQYNVSTASGGVINATAGTAQVGTLAGATLNTGSSGAIVTTLTSGTIVTNGGSVTTQSGTFTGQITGNGGLTKTGTGTLFLNSANSYTGKTVINAGTVEIAVGDALGSGTAPIRIANNGKFKALANVAVTKPVVLSGSSAVYEHVLGESDTLANLAPITNTFTTADIVAGDTVPTTFTSSFNPNNSISLHGLNGTNFLMVLDMKGYIPADADVNNCYLGWWDSTANSGTGAWVNAVAGNIGSSGTWAGAYSMGYQAFLSSKGGWDGAKMLGAYGFDATNQQVWAVINHNSDFGVTSKGILIVPEPSSCLLAGLGVAGGWWRLRRRRSTSTAA